MEKEAASAGFYDSPFGRKYPRLQLVTVGELLEGKEIEYPRTLDVTFKKAPKARGAAAKSIGLPLGDEERCFEFRAKHNVGAKA